MAGRRLSQRTGKVAPDGPYEGVPPHLTHALVHWFDGLINSGPGGYFSNERSIREIASFLRLPLKPNVDAHDIAGFLIAKASVDEAFFLDLVDGMLQLHGTEMRANRLANLLDTAGSVWTTADDYKSLIRVVSDEAQATYEAVTSVADEAATELKEAWANAFGRNGDPSDAWDHAIKAIEDVLIPLIVPNQSKPNLGHVVGQLRNQGQLWKLTLPGKDLDHDVAPLVGMLNIIWPNHDRHGGGQTTKRTPSEQEARAVVTLAATLIQWHRDGGIVEPR